jgi:hypothetical protein
MSSWPPTMPRRPASSSGQTIVDKLAQFKIGARSLLRREDAVPALAGAGIRDN